MMSDKPVVFNAAEQLSLFRQLFGALPLGIMAADLKGDVFFQNDMFSAWIPQQFDKNRLWLEQILIYMEREQFNLYKDVSVPWLLANCPETGLEVEINCQGCRMFFLIRVRPLLDEKGQILGLIELTQNITELKELHNSLEHARRFETVGRLASGIAHDFNNILQVINGHSELMLESVQDYEKIARSLGIILTAGQKASALTRQLLLFSRRQKGEFRRANLGELIAGMQKILTRMLGEDVSLSIEARDRGLCLEADISQLEQILMNLAINARDAMPEGGRITISTDGLDIDGSGETTMGLEPGKYVCLHFADTGCGIPPDLLSHIFDPFFTTKEVGKGTGLGLSTVSGLVKQNGGVIKVDSKLGEGTVFHLCFPQSEADEQAPEASADLILPIRPDRRVLIVEDDENVCEFALQALSRLGFKVTCAANVSQANEIVCQEQFDLFFIDIVLPDGNGVSFLESLSGGNAGAGFVLSSGYTEDKPQIQNTLHKGYSFLHKPFTIHSLMQACSDALQDK